MMKATSTLAALLTLAVFLCLAVSDTLASCELKICLQDETCSGDWEECGTPNGNCVSHAFTAPCSGTYDLHAEVSCQSDCHHCEVCVMIEKVPSGTIVGICSSTCGTQYCSDNCTVYLSEGENYFMYVCKMPCLELDCEDCSEYCKATGCLCIAHTSCTP